MTVLIRGSNQLLIDETDRSLHDAMCVVRSLVKKRSMLYGGSAPEMEVSVRLREYSKTFTGVENLVIKAYADALELIPYTLAENAGLNPIDIVTELRNKHINGDKYAGVSIKDNKVKNMKDDLVVQPSLVTTSAFTLATECVRMILKIDDIVMTRWTNWCN